MATHQLLDPLPVAVVFLIFALVSLAAYEIGFRVGRWWQERTPDEKEGPSGILVGSMLALMAFLLAVTMGMASDRFDSRRQLVLDEANAIGTVYLRAGYLPEPASDQSRELLRAYAPLRVNTADEAQLEANFARSGELQDELWAIAESLAREEPGSEVLALYISALNDMIDLGESRLTAIQYARVPETVILLLYLGAALTLGMVGFHAGLHRHRSLISAVVLVIILGAVIMLVVDLDRPRRGFLQVSQQPMLDVIDQIGPPGRGSTTPGE
jgi:membrane protein YdbS with pleckstrin-like domain